jgi:hypothetical protein
VPARSGRTPAAEVTAELLHLVELLASERIDESRHDASL